MATQPLEIISCSKRIAARSVAHRYRLIEAHICYALFDRELHEITDRQFSRLIDATRIIGEMKRNPNSLFKILDVIELLKRAGTERPEYLVRLTLDHVVRTGFIETIGDGRDTLYRYAPESVERASIRYNNECVIFATS